MNGNYTEIGVGTAEGELDGFSTVFVVQLFGTPAAKAAVAGASQFTEVTSSITGELASVALNEDNTPKVKNVLAENVDITENVVLIEADPVPVAIQQATKQEVYSVEEPEPVEETLELASSFISTSTGGVPASIDPAQMESVESSPYFWSVLTQPQLILLLAYIIIGSVVFISLILSVFIEIRKQHPLQIAYSVALLLLMIGLFKVHELLSAGVVIV